MPDKGARADEPEARVRRKPGPKPGTEAAKRGGQAAAARYGRDFYRQIGKKGGSMVRDKHGSEHYTRIGRMGGEATKAKLGVEHYSRIGKIGGLHRPRHTRDA
jgi:uncharacterized protein